MALRAGQIIEMLLTAKDGVSGVVRTVNRQLTGLKTVADRAGAALKRAFAATGIGGALGAGVISRSALASAANFEQQLSRIQAVTQASAADMALLKQAAEQAGASTKFTATEAGAGLEVLTRAGLSARDAVTALNSVLALAAVEGIDLASAATSITGALGQYQLGATQAGRVADVLVTTSALADTNVSLLRESLKQAGVEASAAGLSIEQTAAALAILATANIRGEQAGTALRNILVQLADPASKFREALAQLGDESGSFEQALQTLSRSGARAGTAILALERDSRGAFRVLLNAGPQGLRQTTAELNNISGAADKAARVAGDNLNGAFTGLASAWDALKRALVEPVLEPLTAKLNTFTEQLRAAATSGALEAYHDKAKGVLLGIADAAAGLVRGMVVLFDGVSTSLGVLLGTFGKVRESALRVAASFASLGSLADERRLADLQQAYAKVAARFGEDSEQARQLAGEIGTLNIRLAQAKGRADDYRLAADQAGLDSAAAFDAAFEAFNRIVDRLADGSGAAKKGLGDATSTADTLDKAASGAAQSLDKTAAAAQGARRDIAQWKQLLADGVISQATFDTYAQGAAKAENATRDLVQSITRESDGATRIFTDVQAELTKIDQKTATPKIKTDTRAAARQLDSLEARLRKLEQGVVIPITTLGGVPAAAFATGGPVPGTGNTDSVKALLTPGEYVITKTGSNILAALRYFGQRNPALLDNIRKGLARNPPLNPLPARGVVPAGHVQQFATGGLVQPTTSPAEVNLNITLPSGHRARVPTTREAANQLVDLFSEFSNVTAR